MFEKLDYVYAVYQEKSFTKAAEKLFIAQPSLSAAIQSVEKEVGAPLFERARGGVTLTHIGKEYIAAAEEMLRAKEEFTRKLHDLYKLEAGSVRVGGTNYLSSYLLPRVINRFSARYPKIEVTLEEAKSVTLSEMLKREEIDVLVDSYEGLETWADGAPLAKERILLCVPAEAAVNEKLSDLALSLRQIRKPEALAQARAVPVTAFGDEPFVLLKSGNDMHRRAMQIFEKANMQPKVAFSVDQLNISYALAQSGMGVCFVTDTLVKYGPHSENVVFYNVEESDSQRTLYIASKKNRYRTAAMKKFMEVAQEVLGK